MILTNYDFSTQTKDLKTPIYFFRSSFISVFLHISPEDRLSQDKQTVSHHLTPL